MEITDISLATVLASTYDNVSIRPGEKLHEQMIGPEDGPYTYEFAEHYKVPPVIHGWSTDPTRTNGGTLVSSEFTYCSDNSLEWMSIVSLQAWIERNRDHIAII
jgi:UDP-N-acetylglucosamine 4,6-dehydratase/5-epimerase